MVAQLLEEAKISVGEAAAMLGVDSSTLWRYHRHGSAGVTLETFAIGGRRYTTREAVGRFIEGCSAARELTAARPNGARTPAQRDAAAEAALAEFAKR